MTKLDNALKRPSNGTEPQASSPTPAIDKLEEPILSSDTEEWFERVTKGQQRMATDEAFRQEIEKRSF